MGYGARLLGIVALIVVAWIVASCVLVAAWTAYVAWHRRRQEAADATPSRFHKPTLVREDGTPGALVEREPQADPPEDRLQGGRANDGA